ncbi:serine hydrolase domain-containing protein [Nocardioides hwasunensis]|uniref:Beta-lactamase family protein n=1 Tax=Nocardioides hwasunensis TaxID=397258 RepID=A0ABR8MLH4_9ACTN|nr:serine hydrolase domain-containing protein [Nocardioides hwasunensis]MBD3915645.1 beta-lactamase family protein [Nocardioides hwasunensis]
MSRIRTRSGLRTAALATTLVGVTATLVPATGVAAADTWTPASASVHAKDAAGRVQQRLDELVSETGLPGAIATVKDSRGRTRTYVAGTARIGTDQAIDPDSRVRVASNTKMFTATVVLQLVAEGDVELDRPVETYLPGLVRGSGNDGRRITVRQLLQQQSGLPDYDSLVIEAGGSMDAVKHTYFEPHELLDAALAERREFRPGTKWAYSNTNYVVLGMLAQKVTGRPIGELITRRVIEPLGLTDTYWPRVGEQRLRGPHPHGYLAEAPDAPWTDATRMDPSLGWAAGQLVSTPGDLGRFMEGLLGGELLPRDVLAEMRKGVRAPGFDAEPGWRYGLGLASRELGCGVTGWGHGGDIQGFETRNLITDDGRWAAVAVTGLPTSLEMVAAVSGTVEDLVCAS